MRNILICCWILLGLTTSLSLAQEPLPEHAITRFGSTRLRHGGITTAVAFADGGKSIVSAGTDGAIRVWDAATGQERRTMKPIGLKFETDAGEPLGIRVFSAQLSNDGTRAVGVGYRDGKLRVWNVADGKLVREQRNGVRMPAGLPDMDQCVLSPDGKWIAELSRQTNEKMQVRLIAADTGASMPPVVVANASPKNLLRFAPDGKTLAWCRVNRDGRDELQFIDVVGGKGLQRVAGGNLPTINSACFSPDGKKLICAGPNGLSIVGVADGKIGKMLAPRLEIADSIVHPNGREAVAIVMQNPCLRVIELETGKVTRRFGPSRGPVASQLLRADGFTSSLLAFSPDGTRLAVAGQGAAIRLYDYAAGTEVFSSGDHTSAIRVIEVSNDGKSVMSGAAEGSVQFWDLPAGRRRAMSVFRPEEGGCVAISNNMRWLAFSLEDSIEIRTLPENKRVHRIRLQANESCEGLAFTPDGRLAIFQLGDVMRMRLFDVVAKKEIRSFSLPENADVQGLLALGGLFSPCGRWMTANTGDSTLSLIDVETGKTWRDIVVPQDEIPLGFNFSPDGRTLLIRYGSDHVVLFEVATGRERRVIGNPALETDGIDVDVLELLDSECWHGTAALAMAREGRLLANARHDGSIAIWDVMTGSRITTFRGHRNFVTCLAFSPDGKTLASGGDDSTVVIWSLAKLAPRGAGPTPLAREHFHEHWKKLLSSDSELAFVAIENLSQAHVIPWIREELQKPRPKLDEAQMRQWLDDLGNVRFAVREKATSELNRLGEDAVPFLQAALDRNPNAEATRRIRDLIEKSGPNNLRDEKLRQWRALEVIERIGTPEAMELLRQLAEGAPERNLTREAKVALKRKSTR